MSDLVDFLKARLDEDEQTAQNAASEQTNWTCELDDGTDPFTAGTGYVDGIGLHGMHSDGYVEASAAVHIARHDPARVLAEVDAKRRVLDEHERVKDAEFPNFDGGYAAALGDVLRLLALPYASHPDYRPEWRP